MCIGSRNKTSVIAGPTLQSVPTVAVLAQSVDPKFCALFGTMIMCLYGDCSKLSWRVEGIQ